MKSYHYVWPIVLQKIGSILAWPILKFFLRIEITGTEYMTGIEKPLIIAANHTSELDVVALSLILPFVSAFRPIYFVSNPQEKFKTFGWRSYFYGGKFFNLLGAYAVISGHHNYAYALQDHIALLRKGRTVLIFPEGRRTENGALSAAHGGVGYLAYTASALVLPVAINTFYNLSWKEFFLRKRKVTIAVGEPLAQSDIVSVGNPKVEDFKEGAEKIMTVIASMLQSAYESNTEVKSGAPSFVFRQSAVNRAADPER